MKRYLSAAVLVLVLVWTSCADMAVAAAAAPAPAPRGPVRAFHFVLRKVTLGDAQRLAREARAAGFNALQVIVTDGVALDHAPWKTQPDAWTKQEFQTWAADSRKLGLEIIPEVKLLTHQEKLFQSGHRDLLFNRSTYDPRKEGTYALVFPLLEEIIALVRPRAVHIGHDEVAGHNDASRAKWLGQGEQMLPADLFLKDVLRIHEYLSRKGIETWMWGDMLIASSEFPTMPKAYLHGTAPGYGKELREKIPRDIVICDWQYVHPGPDFPTLAAMKTEGFRVIGATWKKEPTIRAFSGFAARSGAVGMIATTYFHVQRKEWDVVEGILRASGTTFLKDFPDVR